MISIDEARDRILRDLQPTPPEIVTLSEAYGRVTAVPIVARLTHPPQDVSAMDGYAIRNSDGTSGRVLTVIGSAPAGHPFEGTVGSGQAVSIFTGSIVPRGADAILLQEDALAAGTEVTVRENTVGGRHIRPRGQDFEEGAVLLPVGRLLTARDVGLAAAGNYPWITVRRKPRIVLLATGDEIAMPGEAIPFGGIVSSNTHALAAMIRAAGGEPIVLPVAHDDRASISAAAHHIGTADMLVTTGGASVGEHDLVQSALTDQGLEMDFWKIAMRPGKPLMHGRLGRVPMLGLPGNPVSSIVCATLFLLPAIHVLSGLPPGAPPMETAMLGSPVRANDHRADFLRATLVRHRSEGLIATPFSRQDSGMIWLLAKADALVLRAPMAPPSASGERIDIIRFSALGI